VQEYFRETGKTGENIDNYSVSVAIDSPKISPVCKAHGTDIARCQLDQQCEWVVSECKDRLHYAPLERSAWKRLIANYSTNNRLPIIRLIRNIRTSMGAVAEKREKDEERPGWWERQKEKWRERKEERALQRGEREREKAVRRAAEAQARQRQQQDYARMQQKAREQGQRQMLAQEQQKRGEGRFQKQFPGVRQKGTWGAPAQYGRQQQQQEWGRSTTGGIGRQMKDYFAGLGQRGIGSLLSLGARQPQAMFKAQQAVMVMEHQQLQQLMSNLTELMSLLGAEQVQKIIHHTKRSVINELDRMCLRKGWALFDETARTCVPIVGAFAQPQGAQRGYQGAQYGAQRGYQGAQYGAQREYQGAQYGAQREYQGRLPGFEGVVQNLPNIY